MTTLQQLTLLAFVLIQSIGFSQTENTETISKKQDTTLEMQNTKTAIKTEDLKNFIGKYYLIEADITLEIAQENGKLYLLSPGSKDLLTQKNETTLREAKRGVDLEIIEGNNTALKYTQNGYVTTIKRVVSETKN